MRWAASRCTFAIAPNRRRQAGIGCHGALAGSRAAGARLIPQEYGLEVAKAVLGHANSKITEIYAEPDVGLTMQVMREIV